MGIFNKLNAFENIIDKIMPTVSLDTFLASVSDRIDEGIREQRKQGKSFLGGKTFFRLSQNEQDILIDTEIYFIDSSGGYKRQEQSGSFPFMRLHASDRQEFVRSIDDTGRLCIEIDEPD